jgi:2-hydroxychromene-2-carboxylate isomerase
LPALLERTGAEIVYRPFFLGGVMAASKNSPPITVPNKGRYMFSDIQRWSKRYGVPANPNPHFPVNTLAVMRAAVAAGRSSRAFRSSTARCSAASGWTARTSPTRPCCARRSTRPGSTRAKVLERAKDPAVKETLKRNSDEAVERGAFGAPTFFVGDEMFWGNDRLEFVEDALRAGEMTPSGVALIVGAGDGLGGAIARRFARAGLHVCIARRGAEKLEPLRREIETGRRRRSPPSASTRARKTRSSRSSTRSSATTGRSRWRCTTSAPTSGSRSARRRYASTPRCGRWRACRASRRARGGAAHGHARPRHHSLHRRHGEPAR